MEMKKISLFTLLIIFLSINLTAQDFSTHSYYQNYEKYKESSIKSKRIKNENILPLIEKLKNSDLFEVRKLGESLLGRDINLIKVGKGPTKILAWSQMHGDESTATMALFDIFNFLKADDDFNKLRNFLFENLTIYFIPMLNPDGAEEFTRRNAGMVDLNRDAARLQFPESKILKNIRDEIDPKFGFNLHDQSTYYTAGNTFKSAAISFLAPAFNYEKDINEVRSNTMKVIVDLNNELSKIIPGHIGRYNDDFEPRAFGDNLVKWGTSSILIESGGWKNDNEKQFIRKLNFIGLLVGFESIAKGNYTKNNIENYFSIPENDRLLFDVILRNVKFEMQNQQFILDIAINHNERTSKNDVTYFLGNVSEIGDLSVFYGYEEYDFSNMTLEPGKFYNDDLITKLDNDKINKLLSEGFTTFAADSNYIDSVNIAETKINLINASIKRLPNNELQLFRNANFIIKENGRVRYLIINGFLVNPNAKFNSVENGILFN